MPLPTLRRQCEFVRQLLSRAGLQAGIWRVIGFAGYAVRRAIVLNRSTESLIRNNALLRRNALLYSAELFFDFRNSFVGFFNQAVQIVQTRLNFGEFIYPQLFSAG